MALPAGEIMQMSRGWTLWPSACEHTPLLYFYISISLASCLSARACAAAAAQKPFYGSDYYFMPRRKKSDRRIRVEFGAAQGMDTHTHVCEIASRVLAREI
jgi:hypothetical protein